MVELLPAAAIGPLAACSRTLASALRERLRRLRHERAAQRVFELLFEAPQDVGAVYSLEMRQRIRACEALLREGDEVELMPGHGHRVLHGVWPVRAARPLAHEWDCWRMRAVAAR